MENMHLEYGNINYIGIDTYMYIYMVICMIYIYICIMYIYTHTLAANLAGTPITCQRSFSHLAHCNPYSCHVNLNSCVDLALSNSTGFASDLLSSLLVSWLRRQCFPHSLQLSLCKAVLWLLVQMVHQHQLDNLK